MFSQCRLACGCTFLYRNGQWLSVAGVSSLYHTYRARRIPIRKLKWSDGKVLVLKLPAPFNIEPNFCDSLMACIYDDNQANNLLVLHKINCSRSLLFAPFPGTCRRK